MPAHRLRLDRLAESCVRDAIHEPHDGSHRVSFFGAWAAQNALKKLAREPFAPGDQIGLVRTGQKESRYPFCYSNEALFKGASKLRPNMMASIREYDALFHRVHTLVGTVEGLRGLPGRKAVVS